MDRSGACAPPSSTSKAPTTFPRRPSFGPSAPFRAFGANRQRGPGCWPSPVTPAWTNSGRDPAAGAAAILDQRKRLHGRWRWMMPARRSRSPISLIGSSQPDERRSYLRKPSDCPTTRLPKCVNARPGPSALGWRGLAATCSASSPAPEPTATTRRATRHQPDGRRGRLRASGSGTGTGHEPAGPAVNPVSSVRSRHRPGGPGLQPRTATAARGDSMCDAGSPRGRRMEVKDERP